MYDPRQYPVVIRGGGRILNKVIYFSLLVILVLTPLPYGTVEVWSTAVWEICILLVFVLWGVSLFLQRRVELVLAPVIWPLLAMVLIALVQLMPIMPGPRPTITWDGFATLDAAVKFLVLAVFLILVCTLANTDQRRQQIVSVVVISCVVIAMIGIGQSYLGKVVWPRAVYGPFVNRNHFAGFLEMGIGLAGARVLSHTIRRDRLVLYICFLIVMITGLVLSASRGGFLSLGGVLVFLALTYSNPKANEREKSDPRLGIKVRFAGAVILLVALAFGAMLLTSSDELMQRFTAVQQDMKSGELADERFSRRDLWETSIRIIKDHPMLGTGIGAYQYVYPLYDRSSGILRAEQSHNDYLQIIVDAGIPGGLIALAFLVVLFGSGFAGLQDSDLKRRAITAGALAGCFGIAVHSFVDFNLQVTANAQLFLALAGLATTRPAASEPSPEIDDRDFRRIPGH